MNSTNTPIRMSRALAIVASLTVLAGVAGTADAATANLGARQDVAAASAQAGNGRAGERRYCVAEAATGSRLPHPRCQTRAEWEAEGATLSHR